MSAETGSGIGMGGVAGVGGIATGGGIGIAAGSLGGGIGPEGGSSPSSGTPFSETGTTLNSVMGVETAGMPFASFSLDTSRPPSEAPLRMNDYKVLWSASPSFEKPSSLSIAGPTESLTRLPGSTVFSEAESLDGMFADIGNFMNQSPEATETRQSVLSDVDAFLRTGTDVPFGAEIATSEAESASDVPLSAAEQASLLGLMARIEHFAPVTQEASSPSYDTPDEADGEIPSDVATAVQGEQISMTAPEKRVVNVTSNPNRDAVIETTKTKPATFDFATGAIQQLNPGLDNAIRNEIKESDQIPPTVVTVSEEPNITNETATPTPEVTIVEQEIEADREQVARVLGIIEELEKDMDIADAPALATIAESITGKVANGVARATPAKAALLPEPVIEGASSLAHRAQPEGVDEVDVMAHEEEEPDKKMKPPQPTSVELGQDHRKNQYRTDRIVEAVKEVKEDAEERFAEQGIILDVTEVEGDAVADRLSYLQADDDAISEIVPEDEKDGSIAVLLHQMRDETFQTSADYDKAQVLSLQNTAVKEKVKPPAKKFEIEKVLFIANQHNQQAAA